MLPFKSLDSVSTETADGDVLDLQTCRSQHSIQVVVTGSPDGVEVDLQASMDGVNWAYTSASVSGGTGMATANPIVARYLRAHLSELYGGTSPTVTAYIASASSDN